MATDFTNKYMQVFQNYNEFGEHSADYVRGEDHIAFLIEENEVIYWLYLEQVWRPLNVRTTTTGELEDGRTKVAVKLEYIEDGQKYTSVPNIPDPERITSMSHFLEDYPDIEEVNVSGTVNLTDLSYAFAGSKIKDFSMLDTSNVDDINYIFQNINNENLDIVFGTKNACYQKMFLNNAILHNVIWEYGYPWINLTAGGNEISSSNNPCKLNKLEIKHLFDDYNNTFNNYARIEVWANNQINEIIAPYLKIKTVSNNGIPENVKLNAIKGQYIIFELGNDSTKVLTGNELFLNADDIEIYFRNYIVSEYTNTNLKFNCTPNNSIKINNNSSHPNFNFGGGIKILNDKELIIGDNLISNNTIIGNFVFTTPIVDDAFYAKYNTPISIFQYKTTFEEIADVNISKDVNPDLIYPSNYYNIGNWTENMNVEIYTNIPIPYTAITTVTFNKYILDNRSFNFTEDNCPVISDTAKRIFAKDENSRISGVFKFSGDYGVFSTNETNLFKDIIFYNVSRINYRVEAGNYFKNNNIVIKNSFPHINIINSTSSELFLDVDNLVNDNILGNYITYDLLHSNNHKIFFNYIENVNVEITKNTGSSNYGFLKPYYYYILNSNINNPIKLNAGDNSNAYFYWTFEGQTVDTKTYELNDCYIECDENSYIYNLDQYYIINTTVYYNRTMNANNIYGKVNIALNNYITYSSTTNYIENKLIHIDLNKVKVSFNNACILFYENLDDESTINLIVKLIDNTSESTKTIYMYRSQANIIGEENIAAAVAKNYEFAIIETKLKNNYEDITM